MIGGGRDACFQNHRYLESTYSGLELGLVRGKVRVRGRVRVRVRVWGLG